MSSGGSDSESISECELRQLQNQIKNLFVAATIMNPSIHRKKLIKWKSCCGICTLLCLTSRHSDKC